MNENHVARQVYASKTQPRLHTSYRQAISFTKYSSEYSTYPKFSHIAQR